MKLPPGFPVKVDIPVLPTVSARVTFHDFSWKNVEERKESSSETNGNSSRHDESKVDSNKNGAVSKEANDSKDTKDKKEKGKLEEASSNSKTKKEKKDTRNKSKKESSQKEEKDAGDRSVNEDTISEGSEDSPYLDDSLFQIPAGYVEDNTRFPDL